ncbi:MAG: hypothetical protein ACTS5G_03540, partial [Burkholderiales bacterium]
IVGIRNAVMRPHVFSWFIWTISTAVVFFAQVVADGGAGAWSTGVSGAMTAYVTWLAWVMCRDIHITRLDWVFLCAALASLPLWYLTANPLWAVVILTTIDVLGFGPTVRKLYHYPYEESVWFYFLFAVRSGVSILALESLSLTTLLFPVAMVASCSLVCLLLLLRRQILPPAVAPNAGDDS